MSPTSLLTRDAWPDDVSDMTTVFTSACVSVWYANTPSEFASASSCAVVWNAPAAVSPALDDASQICPTTAARSSGPQRAVASTNPLTFETGCGFGRERKSSFSRWCCASSNARAARRASESASISFVEAMPIFCPMTDRTRTSTSMCSTFWWM